MLASHTLLGDVAVYNSLILHDLILQSGQKKVMMTCFLESYNIFTIQGVKHESFDNSGGRRGLVGSISSKCSC